jgi:hypothetical protein
MGDLFAAFIYKDERFARAMGLDGAKSGRQRPLPANVQNCQIPDAVQSDHGDYLPANPANPRQLSSARFCDEVLSGNATPRYR